MKKKIYIEGMSCGHCSNHVSEALKDIGGKGIEVNLDKKLATAEMSDGITDEAIKVAIDEAGYEVVKIEIA
ncbi:heavy-metal-associated domain-containing protein [Clostridium bowmanii]|uniref:heavy-metal-associated domain-containing protein n=1 Tax=Clostridium bowmanii TaxID=132925 RepID=UPI001C0C8AB3|nr:heavy-metal-associated domain-containing protein [Clostridium bowmanii]MBU3188223.1 heavy-metal-associated domain-containing protein [Clostridium bowmanii]MCA1072609.1 heavy-metal-associated domain-containing protein [Clostridium bowmanii]